MKKAVGLISVAVFLLTNCGGGSSASSLVDPVSPQPSVAISPGTQQTIDAGQTVKFTASVTNDSEQPGCFLERFRKRLQREFLRNTHQHDQDSGNLQRPIQRFFRADSDGKGRFGGEEQRFCFVDGDGESVSLRDHDFAVGRCGGYCLRLLPACKRRNGKSYLEHCVWQPAGRVNTQRRNRKDFRDTHPSRDSKLYRESYRFGSESGVSHPVTEPHHRERPYYYNNFAA